MIFCAFAISRSKYWLSLHVNTGKTKIFKHFTVLKTFNSLFDVIKFIHFLITKKNDYL